MHSIISSSEVYDNIDWNDAVAKDFFGAASGSYTIPDEYRADIQREPTLPPRSSCIANTACQMLSSKLNSCGRANGTIHTLPHGSLGDNYDFG